MHPGAVKARLQELLLIALLLALSRSLPLSLALSLPRFSLTLSDSLLLALAHSPLLDLCCSRSDLSLVLSRSLSALSLALILPLSLSCSHTLLLSLLLLYAPPFSLFAKKIGKELIRRLEGLTHSDPSVPRAPVSQHSELSSCLFGSQGASSPSRRYLALLSGIHFAAVKLIFWRPE